MTFKSVTVTKVICDRCGKGIEARNFPLLNHPDYERGAMLRIFFVKDDVIVSRELHICNDCVGPVYIGEPPNPFAYVINFARNLNNP